MRETVAWTRVAVVRVVKTMYYKNTLKVKPVGFANRLSAGYERNIEIQDNVMVFGMRDWNNEVCINQDEEEREKQAEGNSQEYGLGHVSLRCLLDISSTQLDNESGVKGRSPGWECKYENHSLLMDFNTKPLDVISYGVNADRKERSPGTEAGASSNI